MAFFSFVSGWVCDGLYGKSYRRGAARKRVKNLSRCLLNLEQLERRELLSATITLPTSTINVNADAALAEFSTA